LKPHFPLQDIAELAWLPPASEPAVFGRDRSNPYYDFLYHLVKHLRADRILELGTCEGASTSYLAAALAEARIQTLDIELRPDTKARLSRFPNVEAIQGDSLDPEVVARLAKLGPYDLLFIDTLHEYDHVCKEFEAYLPLVRAGGIIAFDDIRMNDGMARFWSEIELPRRELNHLHHTGFGIAQKL
jgi:predicted O-methyltransferase YrrM